MINAMAQVTQPSSSLWTRASWDILCEVIDWAAIEHEVQHATHRTSRDKHPLLPLALVCRTWFARCAPKLYCDYYISGPGIFHKIKSIQSQAALELIQSLTIEFVHIDDTSVGHLVPGLLRKFPHLTKLAYIPTSSVNPNKINTFPAFHDVPPRLRYLFSFLQNLTTLSLCDYEFVARHLVTLISGLSELIDFTGTGLIWHRASLAAHQPKVVKLGTLALTNCSHIAHLTSIWTMTGFNVGFPGLSLQTSKDVARILQALGDRFPLHSALLTVHESYYPNMCRCIIKYLLSVSQSV